MFVRLTVFLFFAASWLARAEDKITPERLQDFGKQYCFKCHGAEKQKGDFDFEALVKKGDVGADMDAWESVVELLETHEMPPEDKPEPDDKLRAEIIHWIDAKLAAADSKEENPGRVTLRRLNNDEYRNTIRDLLSVDYDTSDFPADETAYGFDTIADALTLPPILMERYLAAADEIVTKALANDKTGPPVRTLRGRDFKSGNEWVRPMDDGSLGLFREGEGTIDADFAGDGEYTIRMRGSAELAGPEPPKVKLSLDGNQLAVFDVKERGRPKAYEAKLKGTRGKHRLSVAYLNNYNDSTNPDRKLRGDRNVFVHSVEIVGPLDVQQEPPESWKRIFTKLPEPGKEAAVAREVLQSFATRAFRRPATKDEVERLAKLVDGALAQKAPFTEAVGVAVQAILCSPTFLFRWELDPSALKPGEIRSLNEYEIASRLSYFLWTTMPDRELLGLAEKGELSGQLPRQVKRMLKDPRVKGFTGNFSAQWLQIRALKDHDVDGKKFPKLSGELREAMKEESLQFFDAIVREDRSLFDLVQTDFTFVNERLADLYGLPGIKGNALQRVALPADSVRGGVLGQAAVLLATSMPTRTSPVVRGKWVLEQILGTPPPPAPANVPPLEETKVDSTASLRVRLEQHRVNPDCAGCHAKIDPVGFALENFDAIGEWRTEEDGKPIDASGKLPNGKKLAGFADLRSYVKGDKFAKNLAEKILTYALGRGLERYDRPVVERILAETKKGGDRMSALILAVVTSDPFLKRQHGVTAR